MLISRKIKQSFIWASLLVLCTTLLVGVIPARKAYAEIGKPARDRIYISGLAFCLYHKYAIDEGKDLIKDNLTSYWDNEGQKKVVTVGFNISQTGVWSCSQIVNPAATALGYVANETTSAMDFLEGQILGTGRPLIDDNPSGISGDVFEQKAKDYIKNTLVEKYLDPNSSFPTRISPQQPKEIAERVLPLIELCFGYIESPPGFQNQPGKTIPGLRLKDGKTIDITHLVNNQGDISKQLGIKVISNISFFDVGDVFGSGDEPVAVVGDGLRTHTRDYGIISPIQSDPYNWHFFAYGNDNRLDMSKNGYNLDNDRELYSDNINSLISCKYIEDHPEIWQFYSLTDGTLNIDGKTAEDLVSLAEEDVNLNYSEGDNIPSCEATDTLGWIACPIISGILNLSDAIFQKIIVPFLTVDPINTSSGVIYTIWSSFRTLGNILLVFALLFIVFGQAIGGGLVDAYTAKKAMPRIFVGAILINLSIYIVAFMVDMGNILGAGIGEMITSPLAAAGMDTIGVGGLTGLIAFVGAVLVVAIPILIILLFKKSRPNGPNGSYGINQGGAVKSWQGLKKAMLYFGFFVAIPLVILIFGIFITLILRLGTILFLCVVSPVALALFVVPSTEKWTKKWFDLLVKAILVYPIIVAIFGISAVLATLLSPATGNGNFLSDIGNTVAASGELAENRAAILQLDPNADVGGLENSFDDDGGGFLFTMAAVIVLFAPLAMIPFSFKLAGGLMGSIIGAVTKGRAGADKLIRGDQHNPHSRFYGMTGHDGYLSNKYGKEVKPFGIRNIAYGLKRVGKKRNIDGTMDLATTETPPDINPRETARAQTPPGSSFGPPTIFPPPTIPPPGTDPKPKNSSARTLEDLARTDDKPAATSAAATSAAATSAAATSAAATSAAGGATAATGTPPTPGDVTDPKPPYNPYGGPGTNLYKGPLTPEDIAPLPGAPVLPSARTQADLARQREAERFGQQGAASNGNEPDDTQQP